MVVEVQVLFWAPNIKGGRSSADRLAFASGRNITVIIDMDI
jgi:hypothetical protein